jgi:hypothetical protein
MIHAMKRSQMGRIHTAMTRQRIVRQGLASACLWLASERALAQDANPSSGANQTAFNPMEAPQLWTTSGLLIFGILSFAGQLILLARVNNLSADDIIRNTSITIVIVMAAILIVTGYNAQQTAQAFGLFGTIIGYLLGRSAGRRDPQSAGGRDPQREDRADESQG